MTAHSEQPLTTGVHMPLDGTLNAKTRVLLRAKEILQRDGWCINTWRDEYDHRCIVGAIETAMRELNLIVGRQRHVDVYEPLASHIPETYAVLNPAGQYRGQDTPAQRAASYNNAQLTAEPLLRLLDKVIASA